MDGKHAGGRGHIRCEPRDDAGQFLHGAARAAKPLRHKQSPESGRSERRFRSLRERSNGRGRSILEWSR